MDRRLLLRGLALAGLAACAPDRGPAAPSPRSSPPAPPGSTARSSAASPSPAPSTTTPAPGATSPPPARTVPILCRDAWGARPARDDAAPHTIRQLTVHHSAVPAVGPAAGPGHLRDYQAFHMDDRGWPDIAYHVAVDRSGYVYRLRRHDRVGDTATDYDPTGHFLLLLDGNFDTQEPTPEQLGAAAAVLAWAAARFEVEPATITGHRDHAATSCPGEALYRALPDLVVQGRDLQAAGGVTLTELCGPEAAAAVTAIETGRTPTLPRG